MPSPFYNAIKGTTSGTPGTGAFTPNAASTGYRAWSNVPTGWVGLVRYEDGTSWELTYSYWNGTTLSRASTQLVDSSSGSALSLTSSAMAAMPVDGSEVMSHVGTTPFHGAVAMIGNNGAISIGMNANTTTGSGAATTLANTNYLTEQNRYQITSATTANAQAGVTATGLAAFASATAGRGGFEFVARFGATTLPTGPRAFIGMTLATFVANTGEPSAFVSNYAVLGKDSTDTNFQLLTCDGATASKLDTGIPWAANGWYEVAIWMELGGGRVCILLIRLDTGAIFYGSKTTNMPAGSLFGQLMGGLNGTNTGTALVLQFGSMFVRSGQ